MEKRRNVLKNQKGFTLIEIIAVLVILGILAAVAVPRFVGMQLESRAKALDAAFAAGASQAVMDYSEAILQDPTQSQTWTTAQQGVVLGDYTADITVVAGGAGTVTVTADADGAVVAANYPNNQSFTHAFTCYR